MGQDKDEAAGGGRYAHFSAVALFSIPTLDCDALIEDPPKAVNSNLKLLHGERVSGGRRRDADIAHARRNMHSTVLGISRGMRIPRELGAPLSLRAPHGVSTLRASAGQLPGG